LGEVEIERVQGQRAMRQFLAFPYEHYRAYPWWVPPLRIAQKELFDRKKHPFYAHAEVEYFLAHRNGKVVGRVAGIHDPKYNEFQGGCFGFFGFFECVDDQAVANALMAAARSWLLDHGVQEILGPMNPSTNYECGLLVDGFDSSPQVMMTYNPPYYSSLLEGAGLEKAKDLYAYHVPVGEVSAEKTLRVAEKGLKRNRFLVRPISLKRFQEDVEQVWTVYNAAWSRNWGFVPMTREEFLHSAAEMKSILDPELILIGEVDGRTAGFALALPDINVALKYAEGRLFPLGLLKILYHKRSIKRLRVLALGVVKEFQTAGVAAGFYSALIRRAQQAGYVDAELSWILEDNVLMNRSLEALGARRYKTYRIYRWN
jgi:GNAT superfamily N-acetyltransferase